MDVKKPASNRIQAVKNIKAQISRWLGRRFVIKGYAFPYKSILTAVVAFLALTAVFYYATFQYFKIRQDPNAAARREIKVITERIGKFMELPQGEVPTLATVSDREKLKGQQFFLNAKNGDKVLVYSKAKKAILYRPSTNKIIEIAPVNIGASQNSAAQ